MGKLKDVQIRNWIKAGDPVAKADGDGLTFTLSAKGTAAWVLRYRFGGKARELTIGRYPDITLSKSRDLAAEDAGVSPEGSGFRGVALAHNEPSPEAVDATFAEVIAAGATAVKPPHKTFWGGYSGYFADPDGHLWEVCWNPFTDLN